MPLEGRCRGSNLPIGIISPTSPFDGGLSSKKFIEDSWVYEGREFIQRELFQAYPRGRDARCWSNLEAFRSIKSQSTAKIFVAPNHTGNAHNALVRDTDDNGSQIEHVECYLIIERIHISVGVRLIIFIQCSWVYGGRDFLQQEVFRALPEGKRSQKPEAI